ncbi:MAG: AAA family ATPase [Phycisphaerales bacterium]|nr:AAA family ATPase [Phycisphaerales bacterium]
MSAPNIPSALAAAEDLHAERAALGAALVDWRFFEAVRAELPDGAAEFSRPLHQAIFGTLCALAAHPDRPPDGPDPALFLAKLAEIAPGVRFTRSQQVAIHEACKTPFNAALYARAVHAAHAKRAALAALDRAARDIAAGCGAELVVARAKAALQAPGMNGATAAGGPVLVTLADVAPEPIRWLWPGRIALGKLTLVAGDPGLGKSLLSLDVAARVSTGSGWPDVHEAAPPGGVVLLSAEDDAADTIRPRLDAAAADVSRVTMLQAIHPGGGAGGDSGRPFNLAEDLPALEEAVRAVPDCRLVIIDPVTAYLGGGVDSHKAAEVRALLAPLGALAARCGVAVLAVTHLNKSAGGPAIYRAMGSLAFAAAARAAWAVTRDRDDPRRRLMLPLKNNLAPDLGGLAYAIEPMGAGGHPVLAWERDPVTLSADEALGPDRGDGGATERAAEWLADALADGPQPARELFERAERVGIAARTLKRAKARVRALAVKGGFGGGWVWRLPQEGQEGQEGHSPKLAPLAPFGPLGPLRPPDDVFGEV